MSDDGDATPQVTPEAPAIVPPSAPEVPFVVLVDRDAMLRRREVVRTVERRGAWVTLVIGVVGIAAALYALVAFNGAGMWPFAVLLILAMIPLLLSTVMVFRLQTERQQWYDTNDLQQVAMRMTLKS